MDVIDHILYNFPDIIFGDLWLYFDRFIAHINSYIVCVQAVNIPHFGIDNQGIKKVIENN